MDATNAATTREERAAKIGDFIRRRRVALGMSQAELGRAIGKNQTWASQRECGYGAVRGEDVEPLAAALRVNPAELRSLAGLRPGPDEAGVEVESPIAGVATGGVVEDEGLRWRVGDRSLPIEELSREDLLDAVRSLVEANGRLRAGFDEEIGEIAGAYEQKIRSLHHVLAARVELEIREAVRDRMEVILGAVMAEVERRASIAEGAQPGVDNDEKEGTDHGH